MLLIQHSESVFPILSGTLLTARFIITFFFFTINKINRIYKKVKNFFLGNITSNNRNG